MRKFLVVLIESYVSGMSAVSPLNCVKTPFENFSYAVRYLGRCSLQSLGDIHIYILIIDSVAAVDAIVCIT